jgi:hypothetical protein
MCPVICLLIRHAVVRAQIDYGMTLQMMSCGVVSRELFGPKSFFIVFDWLKCWQI